MAIDQHYTIRPWTPDDVDFVFANWLNSWRKSRYAGVYRNCDYYQMQRSVIEDLVGRGAVINVADAGPTLLGFACGEVKEGVCVCHYVFVKDVYHNLGIDDALLNSLPGSKPGYFSFMLPLFSKDRVWSHTPEMARRKHL